VSRLDQPQTFFPLTLSPRFRARFLRLAGPKNVRRFANLCESYTQCVGREAELRERGHVLNVDDFIPHRRQNSAVLLCFALVEYILGIDLDDEVYEDKAFSDAYWAACDYVCWANVRFFPPNSSAKIHGIICRTSILMTWSSREA